MVRTARTLGYIILSFLDYVAERRDGRMGIKDAVNSALRRPV
jgi:hypothetical protein